jgi:hypothetical protein
MTATMTQVLAKTTAITKVIQNKLIEFFLNPTKSSANNATNKSASPLLHALFGSAISTARIHTPSLLLLYIHDDPAIMKASIAQNLLPFSVQNDPANQTSKLIVKYSKISLHLREDCGTFCEGEWVQHRRFDKPNGIINHNCLFGFGFVSHISLTSLVGSIGSICLSGIISISGLSCLIVFDGFGSLALSASAASLAS